MSRGMLRHKARPIVGCARGWFFGLGRAGTGQKSRLSRAKLNQVRFYYFLVALTRLETSYSGMHGKVTLQSLRIATEIFVINSEKRKTSIRHFTGGN